MRNWRPSPLFARALRRQVDRAARQVLKSEGLGKAVCPFDRATGSGLEIHEAAADRQDATRRDCRPAW